MDADAEANSSNKTATVGKRDITLLLIIVIRLASVLFSLPIAVAAVVVALFVCMRWITCRNNAFICPLKFTRKIFTVQWDSIVVPYISSSLISLRVRLF